MSKKSDRQIAIETIVEWYGGTRQQAAQVLAEVARKVSERDS